MAASAMGAHNTRDDQTHTPESRHTAESGGGRTPVPEARGLSESIVATRGPGSPWGRGTGRGLWPAQPRQGWQDRHGLSVLEQLEHLAAAGERVSLSRKRQTEIRSGTAERQAAPQSVRGLRGYAVEGRPRHRRGDLRTAARRAGEESADLSRRAVVGSEYQTAPPCRWVPESAPRPEWKTHRLAANNAQLGGPRRSEQRRNRI